MKKSLKIFVLISTVILLLSGCGEKETENRINMNLYLPAIFKAIGLERASDIRTFSGESLWEYIDGGADLYLAYNFIEVATADYKKGEIEIVADLYRFKSADDAYGVYSMIRSPGVQIIHLGVEGFIAPASLNFTRGEFFVRLTGFDESAESSMAMVNLAEEINKLLDGRNEPPAAFSLFPRGDIISFTDKMYAESFLGQKFLTRVYTRGYRIGKDSVTLFLTDDGSGAKFLEWSKLAEKSGDLYTDSVGLPFDMSHGRSLEDKYHGIILFGLKGGRLVGMINFNDRHKLFIARWLEILQKPN